MATLKIKNEDGTWTEVGGIRGKDGATPNITVSATTLAAGSSATVTKSGTAENPVFTFGIPKGDKGDTGASGASYTLPQATSSILGGVTIGSNISVSSGKISLSSKNVTDALGYTPLQNAPVTSVNGQTGAVTISTTDATKVPLNGNRGQLAGYELIGTSSTISETSADACQTGSNVTINNGTAGTAWTKIVRLTAAVTVTIGTNWKWVNDEPPTIVAGGILICTWCGDGGIASFSSPSA